MTDKADNDAMVRELETLISETKSEQDDIEYYSGGSTVNQSEKRLTAKFLEHHETILAALRTPQLDETETRAEVVRLNGKLLDIKRRCLRHPDDTPEDDTRDKRIAYTIASEALKGTDHGRG